MFKWYRQTTNKDVERYGRLSSLWPTFMTNAKAIIDTVRRFTVRAISKDLDISTFTEHRIVFI